MEVIFTVLKYHSIIFVTFLLFLLTKTKCKHFIINHINGLVVGNNQWCRHKLNSAIKLFPELYCLQYFLFYISKKIIIIFNKCLNGVLTKLVKIHKFSRHSHKYLQYQQLYIDKNRVSWRLAKKKLTSLLFCLKSFENAVFVL